MTTNRPTRLDYCRYLLVSQINYTITNYTDHTPKQLSHDAINRYLREERLTSRLVWEHARSQIQPCVHDYVIFDDTVLDMLAQIVQHKQLPFHAVLMDTWYATKDLMLFIDSLHKIYYYPLKDNRQVDDSGGEEPYRRVDELAWTNHEWAHGRNDSSVHKELPKPWLIAYQALS
jgi:hypothetical protein